MPGLRAEFHRAAERSPGLASPAGHLQLRWEDSLSSRPSVSAAISVAIGARSVNHTQDSVPPCEVDQSILNALAESTTRERRVWDHPLASERVLQLTRWKVLVQRVWSKKWKSTRLNCCMRPAMLGCSSSSSGSSND